MNGSSVKEAPARVRVDIFGETYTVRGDGANPEYIATLARAVDERMRELAARSPAMPRNRLAVLVALNLADDLTQCRLEKADRGPDPELLMQKTRYLIGLLDEGMIGDGF